jgi:ketosteroid isomerase-like protein
MVNPNEVVSRSLELNRSGDIEEMFIQQIHLWDPRGEFTSVMAAVEPETCRGHDGLRRYLDELSGSWEEWRMEVEDVFDVSSSVVIATFRSHLVGKGSGATVEARRGMVVELLNGKILRARVYASREDARPARNIDAMSSAIPVVSSLVECRWAEGKLRSAGSADYAPSSTLGTPDMVS